MPGLFIAFYFVYGDTYHSKSSLIYQRCQISLSWLEIIESRLPEETCYYSCNVSEGCNGLPGFQDPVFFILNLGSVKLYEYDLMKPV